MSNNSGRTSSRPLTSLGMGMFLAAGAAFLVLAPQHARADDLWRRTQRHSAAVAQQAQQAIQNLEQARAGLAAARQKLNEAEAELAAQATNGATFAMLAPARAAVAAAWGAVTACEAAVVTAELAVLSFTGGSGIEQGLNWGVTFIWDPILEFDGAGVYTLPDDAEVDAWLNAALPAAFGNPSFTKALFDEVEAARPGTGALYWQFLREGTRSYGIAIRGAGCYTNGDYPGVLDAGADLQEHIGHFSGAMADFASAFGTMRTYDEDPRPAFETARDELDALEALAPMFPDPGGVLAAIDSAREGLDDAETAVDAVSVSPGGPALMLDGQVVPPLTVAAYLSFIGRCGTMGAAALPPFEVACLNMFNSLMGISLRGSPSVGPSIAFWDSFGDVADEASRFGPGGVSLQHEIMLDSIPYNWSQIDLAVSPLVINAKAHEQGTFWEFEQPTFPVGPITPATGWSGAVPPLGVHPYAGAPFPVTVLHGGRSQFLGGTSPGPGAPANAGVTFPAIAATPQTTIVSLDILVDALAPLPPGTLVGGMTIGSTGLTRSIEVHLTMAAEGFTPSVRAFDASGGSTPVALPAMLEGRWYHLSFHIDNQSNRVSRFTLIDNTTAVGEVILQPDWYLSGGQTPVTPLADALGVRVGGTPPGAVALAVDNVALLREASLCRPDLTTFAIPGSAGYGLPNGILNNDDFFYYLSQFAAGNHAVADLTTSAIPGSAGYGVPNGILNNDDFFYYLSIFAAGC